MTHIGYGLVASALGLALVGVIGYFDEEEILGPKQGGRTDKTVIEAVQKYGSYVIKSKVPSHTCMVWEWEGKLVFYVIENGSVFHTEPYTAESLSKMCYTE